MFMYNNFHSYLSKYTLVVLSLPISFIFVVQRLEEIRLRNIASILIFPSVEGNPATMVGSLNEV